MEWANHTIDSTVASPGLVENIKWALIAFDSTGFGFYWNLVALTLIAILILAYVETQTPSPSKDKKIEKPNESAKSPQQINTAALIENPTGKLTTAKEELTQQQEEWRRAVQLPDLTGKTVLETISFLQRFPTKAPIRIVSIPEYTEWAKMLADIFRISGFEVLTSQKATDGIFSAKVQHDKLVLRFPAEEEPKTSDNKKRHLPYHALSLIPLFWGFERAHFDSSSSYKYFQVEIKGAP